MTARPSGSGAGLPASVLAKTANYSAAAGDYIKADASGGGFTVTLPSSPSVGSLVAVKKTDASANVVTIVPQAGSIDGDANATIVTRYAGGVLEHVGSNVWQVVAVMSSVGPTGPTGPQGTVGGTGNQPIMAAGVLNRWYPGDAMAHLSSSLSNESSIAGTLILGTPIVAQTNMTIDALGAYVQVPDAAGVVRLGLYEPNQADPYALTLGSAYATLLSEAGTAAATVIGPTTKTFSSPVVITAGTAFCVGVAIQGASLGLYSPSLGNPWHSPLGSATILVGGNFATISSGVTAALPATFTPSAYFTLPKGSPGWYRRSA